MLSGQWAKESHDGVRVGGDDAIFWGYGAIFLVVEEGICET